MKKGKSIVELAQQLQSLKDNSRDFVVQAERLRATLDPNSKTPQITFNPGMEAFSLNSWSNKQLAQYASIPQAYYDRIQSENPDLWATNVNHGIRRLAQARKEAGKTERRMIRTYAGQVRAVVSSSYRRLDCFDLFDTVAPIMVQRQFEIVSSELTDTRMYLQATTPRLTSEITKGDVVQYGLVISSSDVGAGSVRVEPMVYRLVCLNGMISSTAIRKFHLGRNQAEDDVYELLADETKDLTDAAFWAQVKDVVLASLRPELFAKQVDKLRVAANEPIKNFDIPRVIELASRSVGVTSDAVKQSMVAYLANGADGAGLTRWGLANAFTYAAGSDEVAYDEAVELERAGSKIIDLTPHQWAVIAAKPAA